MLVGKITDRTKLFRERTLQPDEAKLIDDVEAYGCHILQIREENGHPGWSFTVGLYDTLGCPELIVIGLKPELAQSVLNECANRLQSGTRFEDGNRANELLANVECEFKKIESKWIRQTMGYAVWFYGDDDFPVLQCVYPDLENHFAWENGFNSKFRNRQPLLFPISLSGQAEHDFWAANDPGSSLYDWKFKDPPHTGIFTTKKVMAGTDPITRVFHDLDDGAWQFHGPEESKSEDIAYVCFHHIVDKDSTINDLADLPMGWCAWRENVGSPWTRKLTPPATEEE